MAGSSIGHNLVLTSFGESHGKCVGAVLDGCPAGLELEEKDIQKMLDLRRPGQSLVSTPRVTLSNFLAIAPPITCVAVNLPENLPPPR